MNDFTTALISIFVFMAMGFAARRLGLLDDKTTRVIYKFLLTIPLSIVVLVSLANARTNTELLALPIIGGLLAVILVALSYVIGTFLRFERKMLGTLMTAAGISSTLTFALPFILVFYGQEAVHYLFLYDFGMAIVAWTFVYYIGGVMGNKQGNGLRQSLAAFSKTPMIWALVVGFVLSFMNIDFPDAVGVITAKLSGFVGVMFLTGIGVFLSLDFLKHKKNLAKILLGVVVTMGVSGLLAYLLTLLFGVTGLAQTVIIISAIAPSGALTVPFAAEHDLDVEYASALVALPIAIAVVAVLALVAVS